MENKFFSQWESYTKSAIASSKELEAINAKALEQLVDQHLGLVKGAVEAGSKFISTLTEAKDYQVVIAEQTRIFSSYGESFLAATKQATETLSASRDEYLAWLEKGLKTVYDQTQSAVSAASVTSPA